LAASLDWKIAMAIKPEAQEIYFSKRPIEEGLARHLDEAFDVMYGDTVNDMSFWILQAKKNIAERFGFHQEVLAIYSRHASTDARVLTAVEQIMAEAQFKQRLDRVLSIVIHEGEQSEIVPLIEGQKDRIIVLIAADDLRTTGGTFVSAKIAHTVGTLDLFGVSSPIKSDAYFFGRAELVQRLVTRSHHLRENTGLFGLRKTGKTSVLFAVQRRLADLPVLVEYLDCQNPGVHAVRWWTLLSNLTKRLAILTKQRFKRDARVIGEYTIDNAGALFSADVRQLLQDGNLEQIVIMLDEIEHITQGLSGALGTHWDKDFIPLWQTIRATHQETQGRVTFIVAGVNPACVERPHFGTIPNPIFQLALPQYLEPLSRESIRTMVRTIGRYAGSKFDENVYDFLREHYGGHPYLIRIACSEVQRALPKLGSSGLRKVSTSNFIERRDSIRIRLAEPIKDILLSLVWWYPDEYDLLRILAEGDDHQFVKDFLATHSDSAIQFARYGLLRDGGAEFSIGELRSFLKDEGDAYKRELSRFHRGDMPPELLPEVPDLAQLGKLFEKKCEIEAKFRKVIIMYLGVKENWDVERMSRAMIAGLRVRADRKSPEDLFVGRSPQEVINELYTLDLKEIVLANWDAMGALFDANRQRFQMNMDTINRARRVDGHVKPVGRDEAIEYENSYSWMQTRLSRVPGVGGP
jgi:hypothetical protein